jgi:hypothetical protein
LQRLSERGIEKRQTLRGRSERGAHRHLLVRAKADCHHRARCIRGAVGKECCLEPGAERILCPGAVDEEVVVEDPLCSCAKGSCKFTEVSMQEMASSSLR